MYFKIDATVGSEEYLKTYNVFKLGDIAFEGHTNKEYSYGRFVENTIGDGIVSHIFDVFTPRINLDINFWKDLIKYEPIMGPILRRCTKASRMMSNLTSKEFLEEKILCPTVNDTLRMYKNDDIRMYNFNCITDTIVEVITTCNTYTLLTVHLL